MKRQALSARLLAGSLGLALLLTACSGGGGEDRAQTGETADLAESSLSAAAPSVDESGWEWDEESATKVTFDGGSMQIDGAGASADGGTLTISAAGVYVLRGSLTGQVIVEASTSDRVRLVLDGVEIVSEENAAIHCVQAELLTVTLAQGSENRLQDAGERFAYADTQAEEPDAALFSKGDLTINGAGSLSVSAGFYNGIGTKDHLLIEGGSFEIDAAHNGIRGRDSLTVLGGSFAVTAGNDGLQANNSNDNDNGWISLQGGSFEITADRDAIQAETDLTVTGGSYRLVTGGGADAQVDANESYKALKAGGDLSVSGGDFDIDSADDALHANGDVTVSGGSLTIRTGDDGIHADGHTQISGGTVDILQSYEGIEGAQVTISGGVISVVASDDGVNAAGGTDSTGGGGRFGPDSWGGTGDHLIRITGGEITVDAQGDGIDSNGDVEMSGGTLVVYGPTSGGDAALDYDGNFTLTGGTILAGGSRGMAQGPGADSTQPSLAVVFSDTRPAGTLVELADSQGAILASYTAQKTIQTLVITTPALVDGESYTLLLDGEHAATVTLDGYLTAVSETGEAASFGFSFGFGGGMGGGGRGGMPDFGGDMGGDPPALPDGQSPFGDGGPGSGQRPGGGEGGGPGGAPPAQ